MVPSDPAIISPARVGSLKLQVSLAEYRLFYRALLQKRPIILRSLLIVAVTRDHNRVINLIHVAFRLIWDSCRLSTDIKIIGLFCKRAL